jgi:sacsin
LIRLPLRSSDQFLGVDPITKKWTTLGDLTADFKSSASDGLLFTQISSIQVFSRKPREALNLQWSLEASRTTPDTINDDITAYTVSIRNPKSIKSGQEWRIISSSVDLHKVPLHVVPIHRLLQIKFPLVVQVAAPLSQVDNNHNIFLTFPLSISLNLPLHISCPFILTPDESSIRLDDSWNLESSYNKWLLKTIVPKLYLSLLEDRAPSSDNGVYWPPSRNAEEEGASDDIISNFIAGEVYQMAAISERPIFSSKFHAHSLPSKSANLIFRLPRGVYKVLETIKSLDAVQLPVQVTKALRQVNGSGVAVVTPQYVRNEILHNSDNFSASILEFELLQELIDFLSKDGDSLLDLPLLPLEDGSFATFTASQNSCFFVAPDQVLDAGVFKPHRLVHRRLNTDRLLEIGKLNVRVFTDTNVQVLLEDNIPRSEDLEYAPMETRKWIRDFWHVFPSLKISTAATAPFPLIPTIRHGHFLSLSHCKSPSVILADFTNYKEKWLGDCLSKMGVTVIDTSLLPGVLRNSLPPVQLFVESVLKKLLNHPKGVGDLFRSLDSKTRPLLTGWIRSDWKDRGKGYFARHADYNFVPLWESRDGSYVPGVHAQMLPANVTLASVRPFTSQVVVGYDKLLEKMGKQQLRSLRHILTLPTNLEEAHDSDYKDLLRILLNPSIGETKIMVPNSQREMCDSTTLYSSRDDLFLAAFGSASKYFIHPSFVLFEEDLTRFGLKKQRQLGFEMMKFCLEAFQDPTGTDVKERAVVIFRIFCDEFPKKVTKDQLAALNDLRFIPRHMSPRPLGSNDDSQYMRPFPGIVAPKELVRLEYQAIAWTQRAFFEKEPKPQLVKMCPGFGEPTTEEVVCIL